MASVNKVILIGNCGADPEVRYLPSGDPVTTVSIATTEAWKNKSGEKEEHTEWHRLTFFGKTAEIAGEYLKKGHPVYVEGRIRTDKWDDKEGVTRYTTKIIVDRLQLLASKGGSSEAREHANAPAERGGQPAQRREQPAGTTSKKPEPGKGGGKHFDDMDDDIPF